MPKLVITEREAFIFKNRIYDPSKKMTLEQIAVVYGVTRERIRQIESKLLAKIYRFIQDNQIK